ncbi:MAG: hypothetical protein U1F35_05450 [Steroidobacteraceae bacterium]
MPPPLRAIDILASAPVAAYESLTGQEGRFLDDWYRSVDETAGSAMDFWTPNANETGAAGRVLGGFAEMVLPLAATGGNPSLLLAQTQTNAAVDLVNQGVDAQTANQVALLQGAATAVGFRLPFLGKSLLPRVLTGAGGNLAVNTTAAFLTEQKLKSEGYDAQAQQFDPANLESRFVDVLSGAAFGALAHLGSPREPKQVKDAALTADNAKHFQQDTAPGEPQDLESFVAHQDAMESATRALLTGEPVVAPAAVTEGNFAPRAAPRAAEVPEDLQAFDKNQADVHAHEEAALIEQQIHDALAAQEAKLQAVAEGPDAQAVNLRNDSTETAARLADARATLDEAAATLMGDKEAQVQAEAQRLASQDQTNAYARGRALEFGEPPPIHEAVMQRARAAVESMRKNASRMADTARNLVRSLEEDMTRVNRVRVAEGDLERLRTERNQAKSLKDLADALPQGLREAFRRRIDELTTSARKLEVTPRAPAETPVSKGEKPAAKPAEAPKPKPAAPAAEASGAPDPGAALVKSAREALAARPELKVTIGETAPDGSSATISAEELLARGDAEIAQAKQDAAGFEAAVNCLLSSGE